jgi:anti-sigma factor RsiW
MTECRRTAERLAAYVDESLSPDERADVERHLDACPPCRVSASHEADGRRVLRARAEQLRAQPLPPGLRSRCESLARDRARPAVPVPWRSRVVPIALTALLIVFTGTAVLSVLTQRSAGVLAAQLTADHLTCFGAFGHADAAGADAHAVEAMLAAQYGWDVHVPPSSDEEALQLIGGRRCLYAGGRLPHLMYRVNGQDVSLYVLEGVARDAADVTALGHRARVWAHGDTTFVLVSPASAGELAGATSYVMREAQ